VTARKCERRVRIYSPVSGTDVPDTDSRRGADMALIERIVGTGDPELLRLLREAKKIGPGRRTDLEPLDESSTGSQNHTADDLDRLAREAPGEYEAVKRGEKSINAATICTCCGGGRITHNVRDWLVWNLCGQCEIPGQIRHESCRIRCQAVVSKSVRWLTDFDTTF
jgi:hypothetical protein